MKSPLKKWMHIKLEGQWTTSVIQKKSCLKKKKVSVQFLLNSFYPINYLGIPKVGRREATSQQQVTKNTEL